MKSTPFDELTFGSMGNETMLSTHLKSQSGAKDQAQKELDQDSPVLD